MFDDLELTRPGLSDPVLHTHPFDSQTLSQTSELALGAGKIMDQMNPNKLANKAQSAANDVTGHLPVEGKNCDWEQARRLQFF